MNSLDENTDRNRWSWQVWWEQWSNAWEVKIGVPAVVLLLLLIVVVWVLEKCWLL